MASKTKGTPKKKQISPAKRWVFTMNNYPADWRSSIVPTLREVGDFIAGEEIAPKTGTPHLQGYMEFHTKVRALSAVKIPGIHWDKAKGGRKSNIRYCSKDGNFVAHGLPGVPKPVAKMTFRNLRPQQKAISALVAGREDPLHGREIFWFWENKGDWGKSITTMHMIDCRDALVLGGKRSDILCGVAAVVNERGECPPVVVFDIPRACGNRVSYSAMESVKNGFFFSGKYESGMVRFNRPHILVFANSAPDCAALSGDRWRVRNVALWDDLMREVRDFSRGAAC